MNYKLLLQLEQKENEKLQKKIRELTIDNELYKIRLKNLRQSIKIAPDSNESKASITIQQLNIYC